MEIRSSCMHEMYTQDIIAMCQLLIVQLVSVCVCVTLSMLYQQTVNNNYLFEAMNMIT